MNTDVGDEFFDYGGPWMDTDSGAEFLTGDEQGWIRMFGGVFFEPRMNTDEHR